MDPAIPPSIDGLQAYIDPGNTPRVVLSGADVDSVSSVVGSDVYANTLTNRPTYSLTALIGRPGLNFARASSQLLRDATSDAAAQVSGNGAFSLYLAVSLTADATAQQFLNLHNDTGNNYCGIGITAANNLLFFRGAGGVTNDNIVGTALTTGLRIISVVYSGASVNAWVNSVLNINAAGAPSSVAAIASMSYGSGRYGGATSQPMQGSGGKALLFAGAHSTAQRQAHEAWLRSFYQV
ncbi:MAG TPA: hypothetical protein VFZ61_03620 [Polyangiales bacterium]